MKSTSISSRLWPQSNRITFTRSLVRVAGWSLVLVGALFASQAARAQTPVLQLVANNYNPNTGIWTATIGSNATNAPGASTLPALAAGATPNGSPAVAFNGANFLTLASPLAAGNGYTAIAYIKPATTSGTLALFGGAADLSSIGFPAANRMPCGNNRPIWERERPCFPPRPSASLPSP